MIITVDPSQSEDIAAFAMVKQYRLQALNVTLNGGTGSGAWQAVQGGEGYTQTVVTPVTGIELVYEDPNAIVSYTVENDDTSNYDVASNAGIILSSIEPTTNAWTYTCVFHADSVPVSAVDIDLLVYGNIARGTEQQGSPATAEEITAQVLSGLETRVTALVEEMPTKADQATTYTKAEIDTALALKANNNAVVHLAGAETIPGAKTFTAAINAQSTLPSFNLQNTFGVTSSTPSSNYWDAIYFKDKNGANEGLMSFAHYTSGVKEIFLQLNTENGTEKYFHLFANNDGTAYATAPYRSYDPTHTSDVATIGTLDAYTPMVRTTGNQTISGTKTFNGTIFSNNNSALLAYSPNIKSTVIPASNINAYPWQIRDTDSNPIANIQLVDNQNGSRTITLNLYDQQGTRHRVDLFTVTATGGEFVPWS